MFAQIFLLACSRPASHVPEGAVARDLRTGALLSDRQAAMADGFYGTLQEEGQFIAFVRYKPGAFQTTVVSAEGEQADSTSALCLRNDAFAGINGSYFNMKELTAVTLVKDDGFIVGQPTQIKPTRANGAVVLNPESVGFTACDTTDTFELDWEAITSGPILFDGEQTYSYGTEQPDYDSFFGKRHPRSLMGKDADGGVWMVVVDGRFPGEAEGMSIDELTALSRRLGLTEALNLDGGGSSTLWVLPEGVLNHPCDNRRFDHDGQRIVPNAIIVR
ncbi:MAG: phosphodiester glycosidase family protein [Bacteroidales bacterium]|nr:phosphodiester glycosidase family protein [Bacteroidales bacterium]